VVASTRRHAGSGVERRLKSARRGSETSDATAEGQSELQVDEEEGRAVGRRRMRRLEELKDVRRRCGWWLRGADMQDRVPRED
jgi:hypothetical protein